ncbi:MAG TPA: dTMP kinase [Longimicrobiales bacterium]|nr:dTMP kinase [Longimicrobiales bacterium]
MDEAPRGRFLALEGVEGAGKSTQTRLLADWLSRRGVPHVVTREPGGTVLGEQVRRVLLESDVVTARTELLLMLAARATLVETVVRPALARGIVVLTDRFSLSTLAYQAFGRGLAEAEVRPLNAFATGGLEPDLTVVLDVPLSVGVERLDRRARARDRFEQADAAFHERVARAYVELAEREAAVERIDGTRGVDEVHAGVLALLAARFPETFGDGAV